MRTLDYLDIAIPSYAKQVETWKRLRKQRYETKPLALPEPKPKKKLFKREFKYKCQ